MALIPLTYKLDWYDPSEPGGTISTINNNANLATSFATQYSMQDIMDTVAGGGIPWPYQYDLGDEVLILLEGAIILSQIQKDDWPIKVAKKACTKILA